MKLQNRLGRQDARVGSRGSTGPRWFRGVRGTRLALTASLPDGADEHVAAIDQRGFEPMISSGSTHSLTEVLMADKTVKPQSTQAVTSALGG